MADLLTINDKKYSDALGGVDTSFCELNVMYIEKNSFECGGCLLLCLDNVDGVHRNENSMYLDKETAHHLVYTLTEYITNMKGPDPLPVPCSKTKNTESNLEKRIEELEKTVSSLVEGKNGTYFKFGQNNF